MKTKVSVIILLLFYFIFAQSCSDSIESLNELQKGGEVNGILNVPLGEYKIQKDIIITESGKLIVSSGSKMLFAENVGIICKGILEAKGTESGKITFSAIDNKVGWANITFFGKVASQSCLEYCVISHGRGINTLHPELENPSRITSENLGGGIYCTDYASPRFINCEIRENKIGIINGRGGGICLESDANPTFIDCSIVSNQNIGIGGGGGIYIYSRKSITFFRCIIAENGCIDFPGGGIYAQFGNIDIIGCSIYKNKITNTYTYTNYCFGGGLCLNGNCLIEDCKIYDNSAIDGLGGGIEFGGSLIIKNTLIENNVAEYGGGIFGVSGVSLKLVNCEVKNNKALGLNNPGGGIWINTKTSGKMIKLAVNPRGMEFGNTPQGVAISRFKNSGSIIEGNSPNQITEY